MFSRPPTFLHCRNIARIRGWTHHGLLDELPGSSLVWMMAHGLRRLSAFLVALAVGTSSVAGYGFPDCVNGPLANNTVCDTSKDAITRATALIELWTDAELTNNSVNASPGIPRLGLPAYNWWSEALVSRLTVSSTRLGDTALLSPFLHVARRCRQPGSQLRALGQLQLRDVLPPAHPDECGVRRRPHPGCGHGREHRSPRVQ